MFTLPTPSITSTHTYFHLQITSKLNRYTYLDYNSSTTAHLTPYRLPISHPHHCTRPKHTLCPLADFRHNVFVLPVEKHQRMENKTRLRYITGLNTASRHQALLFNSIFKDICNNAATTTTTTSRGVEISGSSERSLLVLHAPSQVDSRTAIKTGARIYGVTPYKIGSHQTRRGVVNQNRWGINYNNHNNREVYPYL